LAITTYKLPHETEIDLENVLGMFLKEMDQEILKDRLAYCLRELAVNAKKANTKRVYFEDKGLDLANREHYEEGIEVSRKKLSTTWITTSTCRKTRVCLSRSFSTVAARNLKYP